MICLGGVRVPRTRLPGPIDGSSSSSNVDLTWPGKLSSISFTYAQDGKVEGGPFIGISDISFQTTC